MNLPDYISLREAARRLKLSKVRVYHFIRDKRLRAYKLDGIYAIPIEELERFAKIPRPSGRRKR